MRSRLVQVDRTTECRSCGGCIAFLVSKRTGKSYPVEVLRDASDHSLWASPFGFHKCNPAAVATFQVEQAAKKGSAPRVQ